MVGTTIATMILTEVSAVANLCCQAFLRTRFLPFNIRYNIYKGDLDYTGCRLATKATSGFPAKAGFIFTEPTSHPNAAHMGHRTAHRLYWR